MAAKCQPVVLWSVNNPAHALRPNMNETGRFAVQKFRTQRLTHESDIQTFIIRLESASSDWRLRRRFFFIFSPFLKLISKICHFLKNFQI